MGNIFNLIILQPIQNALVVFYQLFTIVGLPGAFGFSIIAITVTVRLILHPFFKQQMHTTRKMQELKPHLDKLSKKHKNDAKKLQQEQMRLYREAGVNPATGCLFAIIQIPLFIGLYQTLQLFLKHDEGGKLVKQINDNLYSTYLNIRSIDPNFFGFNLASSPAQNGIWYYYLVPVVTGALQYLQTKYMMPASASATGGSASGGKAAEGKPTKSTSEKSSMADDFQKAMGTQMKYFFPVMIGYFSYTLPLGLSVYWNVFSIFSIIQHIHINKSKDTGLQLQIK
ncbi:hypothetical protein A3A93_06545 [Candidatus Roizmanbacteria bacterium RIFCSPLOWO2_01_FULL_38_12]|uniref:Membrane insertase YidC/Oxa/ALB C-terminal domain-containing protein n=1 Tax=Candidatus Roizmanbacteria bacterium RIFCSPLOWO2_01_FULL_38_12 TaxID=1802061 RepID=A0A1F7ISC1_9BACT|nr:MAG: hypothetical protein A3A93_06545 [Candidatus Roizmanbacteria bacterium RIFCSPLOWO2_01_FULL_38_12]